MQTDSAPNTEPVAEDQPDVEPDNTEPAEEASFPREYVEKLRKESAGYRDRAKTADTKAEEIAKRLHVELVRQTGRLADPTDAEFNEAHLTDPEALNKALDALLEAKPHLKARRVQGDVGQGKRDAAEVVDLAAMLRARA